MATFDPAFDFMAPHEWNPDDPDGGYTNDPLDAGGETKYGISKRANPDLDIPNLTLTEAKERYRIRYWNGYGMLSSQKIANKVFDLAVNLGNKQANKILQQACGESGLPTTVDGQFGPNTIAAANSCDETTLLDFIRMEAKSYYLRIVDANPSQGKFLNGWLKRAAL